MSNARLDSNMCLTIIEMAMSLMLCDMIFCERLLILRYNVAISSDVLISLLAKPTDYIEYIDMSIVCLTADM